MARAERSGRWVRKADIPLILGMVARGDRRHDIAAWFGLNQGRIAEIEEGKHGSAPLADATDLPPSGSPGPKALALSAASQRAIKALEAMPPNVAAALKTLKEAQVHFGLRE